MSISELVQKNEATSERILEKASQCIIISSHHGGIAVKSTFDNTQTQGIIKNLAGTFIPLVRSAVRDLDPEDDLRFLRILTKKFEYLVSSEPEYTIVVQQTY